MSSDLQIIHSPFGEILAPFIKWPGGKTSELPKIQHFSPLSVTGRYIEPFVGAGAVMFGIANGLSKLANDKCWELMSLFQAAKEGSSSSVYYQLMQIGEVWERLDLSNLGLSSSSEVIDTKSLTEGLEAALKDSPLEELKLGQLFFERVERDLTMKLIRTRKIELEKRVALSLADMNSTLESSIRSSFYMAVRERFNDLVEDGERSDLQVSFFFFIREYAYAAMFRYNSQNRFNVPYGGISYNKKSFTKKVQYLFSSKVSEKIKNAEFYNLDFEEFVVEVKPDYGDFVFVDPPYDTVFSNYNNNEFPFSDQERLEEVLRRLRSNVMVVIGYSEPIQELYSRRNHWNIESFEKSYLWNVKSRNDGKTRHLVIRNY